MQRAWSSRSAMAEHQAETGDAPPAATLVVGPGAHASQAAVMARSFAASVGCDERTQWEIATVCAELASNIIKHVGRGQITIQLEPSADPPSICIVATDPGPFIGDPGCALVDGYSRGVLHTPEDLPTRRHGLGIGLGAVQRWTDELRIEQPAEGGTRVSARRRVNRRPP
jgi:anti-sigma regulatory factor (Ser/Thr protein kinase)